jgi:ADP-ribosyl-[dinitrogen reductase] hydrolase
MYGAIIGDIIGSVYEFAHPPIKTTDFDLFTPDSDYTDDTVLTCAVAEAIINQWDFREALHRYGRNFPGRGYGGQFQSWLFTDPPIAYNSFGNGSAMRVSPVGYAYASLESVLREAKATALPTHNHPEGIKGAQATAVAVFMASTGSSKEEIKQEIVTRFGYDLNRTVDEIRPVYQFNETCQGTVPEALIAFLESEDYESAIRLAVSLGGDADTLACITGGIAQAYYKVIPQWIQDRAWAILPPPFKRVIEEFNHMFGVEI